MSNWRKTGYTTSILLGLLILSIIFPIYLKPDDTEGATKDATPSTLTFTATSTTASANLSVTSSSGDTATSSTNASFSLSTNNATGYTLNLKVGTSGYSTLKKTDDNTKTIESITSSSVLADLPANTWGLLPSKYNGTANTTTYYPASSAGFIMDTTNSANTVANSYTVGLGLKANYNTPAGTYTNTTIVAEYVANPVTYAIYYYSNTTDTVTGMPSPNPQVPASAFPGTTSTTVNLASAPSRTGYTFLGWCLGTASSSNITVGTNGAADTCASSSTNQFTAGQSFGINATGSSPDLYYFYAMWQANTYTVTISNTNTTSSVASLTVHYGGSATVTVTPNSGYYLSSVSCPSGYTCTGYNVGESYTSAQTITVTNNNTTSDGTLTFTGEKPLKYMWDATFADCGETFKDNRDGTERQYTTAEINGLCWMTQNLMLGASSSVTLYKATTNITANTYILPARGTSGTSYDGQYVWGNDTQCTSSSTTACAGYYSYATATAGTNPSSSEATSDICPKGWRLPTQAELTTLKNSYSTGSALTGSPFLGVYAGFYLNSSFRDGGSYGYYWSSTAYNSNYAYYLYFNSSSADANYNSKYLGSSVRCVKEKPYMQNQTSTTLAALMSNNGDTTTLYDNRDEQAYSIAKINGAYWMTRNLAIGCNGSGSTYGSGFSSKSLTSSNSNISASSWSTPTLSLDKTDKTTGCMTYATGDCNSYTNARMKCSSTYGAWYNYAAATAGTIATSSTTTVDTYNICPKGWTLPGYDTNSSAGSIQSVTGYMNDFSPVAGGTYYGGEMLAASTTYGYWWSTAASTRYSDTARYFLQFNGSSLYAGGSNPRLNGYYVRCIKI